ncbi:hypothetical protein ACFVXQ_14045, partial [Kitasatospora sp. NPDC058263]
VSLRTIYQDSVRNDPETLGYAQWMTGLGGRVRTAPVLPPRMLVFDRSTAVVPIDPENTRLGALCTEEPGIVASLVALFEQTWETAVPLGTHRAEDAGTGLSAGERELLRLLSGGGYLRFGALGGSWVASALDPAPASDLCWIQEYRPRSERATSEREEHHDPPHPAGREPLHRHLPALLPVRHGVPAGLLADPRPLLRRIRAG